MSEFTGRVEAQRQILTAINRNASKVEQLFSLNAAAIQRWVAANHIVPSSPLVKLLHEASAQIFAMANHSDDPVAGTYKLTRQRVAALSQKIERELQD